MNFKIIESKRFLFVFISILAISLSIAYASLTPRDFERFMSISTLGSSMLIDDYYPNPNSVVKIGDNVTWYVQIFNRMGNSELVSIRVKVLNSTDPIPDDNNNTPSPIEHIYEAIRLVKHNSTWTYKLSWSILEIERNGNYTIIKKMNINGKVIELNVRSIEGKNFRIVLELWRYNPDTNRFEFSWRSNIDTRSAWNQIWFNMK